MLRCWMLSLALVVSVAGGFVAQAQAKPVLYFAGDGLSGVGQMNLDGSGEKSLVDDIGADYLSDLKADASRVYWSDVGFAMIGAVGIDGKQLNRSLIDLRPLGIAPTALAVQGAYVYFAWSPRQGGGVDSTVAGIGRANRDGSNIQPNFIPPSSLSAGNGPHDIGSLAVDGAHVYWVGASAAGSMGRAKLDGTDVQQDFISSVGGVGPIAVDRQYVFWSNFTSIGRANVDGTDIQPRFRSIFRGGTSIAISRNYLFWGAKTSGIFGRMDLDGSDVFACFFRCAGLGPSVPEFIAVSPGSTPKPAQRCSIAKRSISSGDTLVASCAGVSGLVTITVADTLGSTAAAPAGTIGAQLRFSRTVRRGRIRISTKQFCRDRFTTSRYRILFNRHGHEKIGEATVRLRSQTVKQRCKAESTGIDG